MSDDKIKTMYMCSICYAQYDERKKAEQCVKSHESDKGVSQIELGVSIVNPQVGFYERKFRAREDYNLHTEISKCGLYDGYPKFIVECPSTLIETLAAKRRLIAAAYEWIEKYRDVLAGLVQELEEAK